MRYVFALCLCLLLFAQPVTAWAADFNFHVQFGRADDGNVSGEVFFNNKLVWRLRLLTDGARPVSSGRDDRTTFLSPHIAHGLLLIKISHPSE